MTSLHPELVWFVPVISSLLWMIGGTWWKPARRFLIPLVALGAITLWLPWSWWYAITPALLILGFCLPFTLKGDGIPDSWINWVWACLLKPLFIYLATLPEALILGQLATFLVSTTVCMGFWAAAVIGSNKASTARFFPWKLCEAIFGAIVLLPLCFLIELS